MIKFDLFRTIIRINCSVFIERQKMWFVTLTTSVEFKKKGKDFFVRILNRRNNLHRCNYLHRYDLAKISNKDCEIDFWDAKSTGGFGFFSPVDGHNYFKYQSAFRISSTRLGRSEKNKFIFQGTIPGFPARKKTRIFKLRSYVRVKWSITLYRVVKFTKNNRVYEFV